MHERHARPWLRRVFQATPAGVPTQALAIAALVAIPVVILAALPVSAPTPPADPAMVERRFALACTRTFDAEDCGCAATGLRALLGRDEFRAAVLRNAGNIFGDRDHSATAHRIMDACRGVPVPPPG